MGSLQGLLGSECDIRRTAEPLVGIKTLAEYTDWMKGLMTIMPDGSYEVAASIFGGDETCQCCCPFAQTGNLPRGPHFTNLVLCELFLISIVVGSIIVRR